MKVRFLESVTVPATKFGPELHFKKGSVHDLSGPSSYRWVRRNKAVYVVEEAAPTLKVGRPMMKKPQPEHTVFVKDSDFTKTTKPTKRKPKRA